MDIDIERANAGEVVQFRLHPNAEWVDIMIKIEWLGYTADDHVAYRVNMDTAKLPRVWVRPKSYFRMKSKLETFWFRMCMDKSSPLPKVVCRQKKDDFDIFVTTPPELKWIGDAWSQEVPRYEDLVED